MRGIVGMQFTQLAAQGSWAEEAACRGSTMDFTSDDPGVIAAAKRFCRTSCPVREQCLQHALKYREEWGVWGGLDPDERLPPRTKETPKAPKASRPPKPVNPPRACLVCGDMFKSPAHNAQVCSDKCRQVRTRIREASYAGTVGTRLCPKCFRAVKPRFTTIPRHFDGTGKALCPTAGEPYSITLSHSAAGAS